MEETQENSRGHFQIAIIGAGPAGSTLSLLLSKRKISHLIIDKATFPRDKICGDALTLEGLRALREIDEDLFQEFIHLPWVTPSRSLLVKRGNKELFYEFGKEFDEVATWYVSHREKFDHWLFSKLPSPYAEVKTNCEAISIEECAGGLNVNCSVNNASYSFQTSLLIGADGERSIVRKRFHPTGIKKDRRHTLAAIRTYYENVEIPYGGNPLEFHVLKKPYWGYFWIFKMNENTTNVGLTILSSEVSKNKVSLKDEFQKYIEENPEIKARFAKAKQLRKLEGWGIPINSDAVNFTGDNWLLIGDSAKFAEALTGKGIGIAMYWAYLAIPTIERAIAQKDFSNKILVQYEKDIQKRFGWDWKLLNWLQAHLFKSFVYHIMYLTFSIPFVDRAFKKLVAKNFFRFLNKPLYRRED